MILDEIVEKTKVRLEQKKKEKPFDLVKKEALSIVEQQFYFEKVLKSKEIKSITIKGNNSRRISLFTNSKGL